MRSFLRISFLCTFTIIVAAPLFVTTVHAANTVTEGVDQFVPLVGIPFVDTKSPPQSLSDYANALYIAAISLAAVIAVLKIIFAGVKYMLSDIVTDKSAAKKDIQGALVGLVLIIGAVLILNTINPTIANITALQGLDDLTVPTAAPTGVGGTNTAAGDQVLSTANSCITSQTEIKRLCETTDPTVCDSVANNYLGCNQDFACYKGIYNSTNQTCTIDQEEYTPTDGFRCTETKDSTGEIDGVDCTQAENDCVSFGGTPQRERFLWKETLNIQCVYPDKLTEAYCPAGEACRVELCNHESLGTFESCAEYCTSHQGTAFDADTNACIYTEPTDVTVPADINQGTTYYMKLTEDQVAAGDEPVQIKIIGTGVVNGLILVEYPDGSQHNVSCGYTVPETCNQSVYE